MVEGSKNKKRVCDSRKTKLTKKEKRNSNIEQLNNAATEGTNAADEDEPESKRKHLRNDTALFDRRSFTEGHSSSMFDSLDHDDNTTFASDMEIVDPKERTKNIVPKVVPETETSVKK